MDKISRIRVGQLEEAAYIGQFARQFLLCYNLEPETDDFWVLCIDQV